MVYAALAAGMNHLAASLHRRGAGKLLRALKKQLRGLYKTERQNFELWLRARLQRDAGWRQSVLEELGGERALRRWERRAAKINTDSNFETDEPARAGHGARSRSRRNTGLTPARSGIKTAAQGVFRLAVIKRGSLSKHARFKDRNDRQGCGSSCGVFPVPGPIGLTPDELRGQGSSLIDGEPLSHIAPFDLWAALLGPMMKAFHCIQDLELSIALGMPHGVFAPSTAPRLETGPDDSRPLYSVTHPV